MCALVLHDVKWARLALSTSDQILLDKSQCDLICLDVFILNIRYRIILVYRPPNTSYNKLVLVPAAVALRYLLYNLAQIDDTLLIMGNFNLPLID